MQVHLDSSSVEVVTKKSEMLEMAGLLPLLAIPFVLAGSMLGLVIAAAVVFAAVVIHSAIRHA